MRLLRVFIATSMAAAFVAACLSPGYGESGCYLDGAGCPTADAGAEMDGGANQDAGEDAGASVDSGMDAGCMLDAGGGLSVGMATQIAPLAEGRDEYNPTWSEGAQRLCVQLFLSDGGNDIGCAARLDGGADQFTAFDRQSWLRTWIAPPYRMADPELTADGERLYFSVIDESAADIRIFMARRDPVHGFGYSGIHEVSIAGAPPLRGAPSLTNDGAELFFHGANAPGAPFDLYVARRVDDLSYAAATKLDVVSSAERDIRPAISGDGTLLLFESDRMQSGAYYTYFVRRSCAGFGAPTQFDVAIPTSTGCCGRAQGLDFGPGGRLFFNHSEDVGVFGNHDVFVTPPVQTP